MTWYADTSNQGREGADDGYPHPLADWAEAASLRQAAINFNLEPNRDVFASKLIPARTHPLLSKLKSGALDRLSAHHLLSYLRDADARSNQIVIPATNVLGALPGVFGISAKAGRDARLVQADETYRSWTSVELSQTIRNRFEVRLIGSTQPKFFQCFEDIKDRLPERLTDHLIIQFACISEMSSSDVPWFTANDANIAPLVGRVMRCHAGDQVRHTVYFSYVLDRLWATWSRDERSVLGPLFARLLRLSLEPDLALTAEWLEDIGLCPRDADRVVRDCYSPAWIAADVQARAEVALRQLKQIGVLEHEAARKALIRAAFIH